MTQKRLSQAHRRILNFLYHTGLQPISSSQVGAHVGKKTASGRMRGAEWASPKLQHLEAMGLVHRYGHAGWVLTQAGRRQVDIQHRQIGEVGHAEA